MGLIVWVVSGFICLLIVLVILHFLIIKVELTYERERKNDVFVLTVTTLGGLIKLRRNISLVDLELKDLSVELREQKRGASPSDQPTKKRLTVAEIVQRYKRWQQWVSRITGLYAIAQAFLKKVRCKKLVWHTTIGTEDAAVTGALTGMIWGLQTAAASFGCHSLRMETEPQIAVSPNFSLPAFEVHFCCILQFRLGQAIFAGTRIFLHLKKSGRSEQKWRNTPSKA